MSYTSKKPCTISASDEFDCIEICGKYALFTDERLTPSDVPAGMHLYHLRQTDDGRDFATLEQTVFVNHVIFPVIDLVLAVLFFIKVATAYLDYRKHGQFEWTAPAILLGTLVFSLTCPLYIWKILGM